MQLSNDKKDELSITLKELTEMLIDKYGIRDGKYDLAVEFAIGVGKVGPNEDNILPGVMIGVSKLGLVAATEDGPNVVDATARQPKKKAVARKTPAKK